MGSRIYNTDEDVEYREAVRAFYQRYNSLKKKRALRCSDHSDPKGAWIKIREYRNSGEIKIICSVRAGNLTDCYRMAADRLKWEADRESPPHQ